MDVHSEQRRHSAAHVLAMAALRLFPGAKLGIGPVTNEGYYHDIEFPTPISWEDVKQIEAEMNLIIQQDLPFNQLTVPRNQAFEILMTRGQIYKSELLQSIGDENISFYKTGNEFIDLCRGPHVESTNKIGSVKLTEIKEVHWKGELDRPKLQRITGVAFATPSELTRHLKRAEEIKSRDYVKYAKDTGLMIEVEDKHGYTQLGTTAILTIEDKFVEQLRQLKYEPVRVASTKLLHSLDLLFTNKNRSYRSLPWRTYSSNLHIRDNKPFKVWEKEFDTITEFAAKSFFPSRVNLDETQKTITSLLNLLQRIGIAPIAEIHTSDLDSENMRLLTDILSRKSVSQTQVVDTSTPSHTVEVRLVAKDELDREWPLVTIIHSTEGPQFVNTDGNFTSSNTIALQLFSDVLLAYLLEHNDGSLPYWITPIQATIIPIAEEQGYYAEHVHEMLTSHGIRSELDNRHETMQARIRDAEINRIPIIIIIGEKEQSSRAVSIRVRDGKEVGLVGEQDLISTIDSLVEAFPKQ